MVLKENLSGVGAARYSAGFYILLVIVVILSGQSVSFAQRNGPSLEVKLRAQWQLYKAGQELLLEQVNKKFLPKDQRAMSLEQWEKTLALSGGFALTQQDLIDLKNRQANKIAGAKTQRKKFQ